MGGYKTEALEPCLFCPDGGEPYVLTGKSYTFENGIGSMVECAKCWASGPLCNTEEEAIERWNTRAERTCEGCVIPERDYGHAPYPCFFCARNDDRNDLYEPKVVS